jgi:glycosyltransferase involved in cell wall biosynthesis
VYAQAENDARINFAGPFPNEQMADELAKIDVLAVPSLWYENAPLVVYSALAIGIPVVASNQVGMAEIVDDHKNGLLFKSGDPADLATQLKRLTTEPKLIIQLGEHARNVRTVEDSVDEMLDLYESLPRGKNQQFAGGGR